MSTTPGPWVARKDPHGFGLDACIGVADESNPIDCVAVCSEKDARLIAAAPRMYIVIEAGATAGDIECMAIVEAVNGRA
jgi:hypothetical protein